MVQYHNTLSTSQQNGRAKRKHGYILQSIKAMLIVASFPATFQGEATLTAIHTINHVPSSILEN